MPASNEDIMFMLGQVKEGITRLTDDFSNEKDAARVNRAAIHTRLDIQAKEIGSARTDIAIAAGVAAQNREEIKAVQGEIVALENAVTPSVKEWQRMKTIGNGIAWMIAIGGLSLGATVAWFGEQAATWIRHWLRID